LSACANVNPVTVVASSPWYGASRNPLVIFNSLTVLECSFMFVYNVYSSETAGKLLIT